MSKNSGINPQFVVMKRKYRESVLVVNTINMLPEWWIYHDQHRFFAANFHGKMMMNHWSLGVVHSALPIP